MKRITIPILICLFALTLTGCSAKGKLYKKSFVLRKVSENVPSEKYKFDHIEPIPDADVSTEIYHFRSKERDMEFTAVNTRAPAFFESGLYGKTLTIKYAE